MWAGPYICSHCGSTFDCQTFRATLTTRHYLKTIMVGSETKLTQRTKTKTDVIPYGIIKTTAKGKASDKLMDQHQ